MLAHAKKLRAIAEANYKSDEIDAVGGTIRRRRVRFAGVTRGMYLAPVPIHLPQHDLSWHSTVGGWDDEVLPVR